MNARTRHAWLGIAICCAVGLGLIEASALAQTSLLPTGGDRSETTGTSQELLEFTRRTEELKARLASWKAKAAEYERAGQEAQARTELIDQEIAGLQERNAIELPEGRTAAEFAAQLVEAEQDLAAARREATELDAESQAR
ncbi:MAG: hypothetical protein WBM74_05925, partial [Polyangiales bacterium]